MRVLCVAVVICFLSASATRVPFCSAGSVSEDQTLIANQMRIEPSRQSHGNLDPDTKDWTGYLGPLKLSESELFRIAGYLDEAESSRKYHNNKYTMWGFGALFVAGGLIWYASLDEWEKRERNTALILSVSGLVIAVLGSIRGQNWAPASLAIEAAESYNSQLREAD